MQENPYEPPAAMRPSTLSSDRQPSGVLSLPRAAAFVLAATGAGAAIGLAAGACLGLLLPSYYRGVFSAGDDPRFDPLAVGIGLGSTQGAGLGTLAGLVLVLGYWWFQSRLPPRRS